MIITIIDSYHLIIVTITLILIIITITIKQSKILNLHFSTENTVLQALCAACLSVYIK